MKFFKYTFCSLLLGVAVSSCNFLDKTPNELTPEVYFNTEEEAMSFLTGITFNIMEEQAHVRRLQRVLYALIP